MLRLPNLCYFAKKAVKRIQNLKFAKFLDRKMFLKMFLKLHIDGGGCYCIT